MKVALCFIINYDHILNNVHIWRKWIDHNNDIINVYLQLNFNHKERDLATAGVCCAAILGGQ